jgi:hypothetical protein
MGRGGCGNFGHPKNCVTRASRVIGPRSPTKSQGHGQIWVRSSMHWLQPSAHYALTRNRGNRD